MWRGPHWGRVSRGSRQLHVLQHEGEREGGKTQPAEQAGVSQGGRGGRRSRRGPQAGGSGGRGQAGSKEAPGVPGCPARPPRGRLGLHPPLHSLSHLLNLILKNHTFFSWAPSGSSSHAISADFYAV